MLLLFLPSMKSTKYHVIGVMSGTSLDGIDLIFTIFNFNTRWTYEIIKSETITYPFEWNQKLGNLVSLTMDELVKIDADYTQYLALIINDFKVRHSIKELDAICSHGHTALHQPDNGITYQIGNRAELASLLDEKIICDFRVQDVQLGGQGAPLVPIGDQLLFSEYNFCLNLGGFANISMEIDEQRIAFDICPVNIILNKYVKSLGLAYDDEGKLAKSGKTNEELLKKLNQLDFYSESYPKSLGLEWVNQLIVPLIDSFNLKIENVLCTFCEHVAIQISKVINQRKHASVLITGGGAYNSYLIERLKYRTEHDLILPEKNLIEFKEALIFGFLGVLKLRNEINCLKSVTGASQDHSSGVIFMP